MNPKQRWTISLGLIALLAAGAMTWAMRWRMKPPQPTYDHAVFAPRAVTLAQGVHLLGELAPGAAYVIETSDGLILIDTGVEANATLVAQQLTDLGLDLQQLKIILISHVHGDHSLGAKRLRELTSAKVYAGAGDVAELEQGGPRDAFFSTFYAPHIRTHATKIDVGLKGGEVLQLGDVKLDVLATPGHTPGSLCFLMQRGDERILFTGDTICTLTSVIGTYAAHLAPRYRGSAADYLATLKTLKEMAVPDLILPGHPRMGKTHQPPRLTQAQWEGLLDTGITEMEELLERYRDDGLDFLDGEPKEILPGLFYLGEFNDRAVYCLRNKSRLYCFDAPGGKELRDFVRHRLKAFDVEGEVAGVLLTSTNEQAVSGLAEFVQLTGCAVVVPKGGLAEVQRSLPAETKVLSADQLDQLLPVEAESFRLGGVGANTLAYQLQWQDRSVLVTGGVPTQAGGEEEMQNLVAQLRSVEGDAQQYLSSIHTLQKLEPDVWLPTRPVQSQNANLYDSKWQDTLQSCLEVVFFLRSQ